MGFTNFELRFVFCCFVGVMRAAQSGYERIISLRLFIPSSLQSPLTQCLMNVDRQSHLLFLQFQHHYLFPTQTKSVISY